jgi:heterodisulfide reductase subunit A
MMRADKVGAVLVVGGGVGGIQAALDLADAGFKAYLLEQRASIGGTMAQLDKTFPTNDCSMCILAPKLVSVARHPNVELVTYADLMTVDGDAGNYRVGIRQRPRFVDAAKCVGCGVCSSKCPVKVDDAYNENLNKRRAIAVDYPQAVPATYYIDPKVCLNFTENRCRVCERICPAKAIEFAQKEEYRSLNVGAIIIAAGVDKFDPRLRSMYGYGRYANVIKSIELERLLNASGPTQGHLVRLSDQKRPGRIGFVQCVGSRDAKLGIDYCSSVCCVYAIKESILIKEHYRDTECSIFCIDTRTFGKGFEAYYERAKSEYGIRFKRALVAEISEVRDSKNVLVRYEDENGKLVTEELDLLVLSVGLIPNRDTDRLAKVCNVELNDYGFIETVPFSPIETSRKGIFACGTVSAPKDIPETVTEASAAAGKAIELLRGQRHTLTTKRGIVPEIDVTGQESRIGVFVCHCGINIAGVVDVERVVEYARSLPNVVYGEDNLYSCSDDTQRHIKEMIEKHGLNRIVIAACTPRTHEPLFQETIREKGLNKYLLEFANIRDQCSWVHPHEPAKATEKAMDLVRMACARSALLEPLPSVTIPVSRKALIIGGGVSGLNAAFTIANQGYETFVVERELKLGGNALNLFATAGGRQVSEYLRSLIGQVESHQNIHVYTGSTLEEVSGYIGNFRSKIKRPDGISEVEHGVIVVATGAVPYKPKEYLYGESKRVLTQQDLENELMQQSSAVSLSGSIVMIQCVGSRVPERKYCSRVCCTQAIKNALIIKEKYPDAEITILYRDMRSYGFNELLYQRARNSGVVFIRYDDDSRPELRAVNDGFVIKIKEQILDEVIELSADLIVLSTGIAADVKSKEIAQLLKVPLNDDGFFLEAHMKLRPVDFATDGIFVCGLAHSPKTIDESIVQAMAAADRASIVLSQEAFEILPTVAHVNEEKCIGCGICEKLCLYQAHVAQETEKGIRSLVIAASCKGCGSCAASCPQQAIVMLHYTNEQIEAQIDVLVS